MSAQSGGGLPNPATHQSSPPPLSPSPPAAMGDWPELLQSAIIGLIFSFLVAKLISIVISFKEDNLRLVRDPGPGPAPTDVDSTVPAEPDPSAASAGGESDLDDDWEGVESTELDEVFSAATAFVAATAADKAAAKVGSDVQLQLYGLYKIATEGPCTAPQPSAIKVTARAKWNAWQKLGAMSPEEAMEKYVIIVSELYPSWANGSAVKNKDEGTSGGDSASSGPMGPVFSSFVYEEDPANDPKLDALHVCAREGEADQLLKYIDDSVSVNLRDSEGRTALHWAVDRGHINVVEALLSRKADVNAKDNEGETPLHYAVLCEREAIGELLVKHHADPYLKDEDGNSPSSLCGPPWSFMASAH